MKIGPAPRRAVVALTVLVTSCAIAACGSSSAATTATKTTASSGTTSGGVNRTAFRTCLQQHGVTLPSRRPGGGAPGGGASGAGGPPGGGGFFGGGAGGGGSRFATPKFQAALKACSGFRGRFRAGAGGFRGRISHAAIENFVACVRKHGYPQMPSPNFSGKGAVFPSRIRTNSHFQAASRACTTVLIPPRTGTTGPGA